MECPIYYITLSYRQAYLLDAISSFQNWMSNVNILERDHQVQFQGNHVRQLLTNSRTNMCECQNTRHECVVWKKRLTKFYQKQNPNIKCGQRMIQHQVVSFLLMKWLHLSFQSTNTYIHTHGRMNERKYLCLGQVLSFQSAQTFKLVVVL